MGFRSGCALVCSLVFFVSSVAAATGTDIAAAHLKRNHRALGLTERDVTEAIVAAQSVTRGTGVTHVRFQQQLGGIDVLGGALKVNVASDGRIVSVSNHFVPDLAARATARAPKLTAAEAVTRAALNLRLPAPGALRLKQQAIGASRNTVFAPSGVSKRDIPVRLVYVRRGNGPARLAWDVAIETDSEHYWQMQIDATTGQLLQRRNLVLNHSYKVYPIPAESPNHIAVLPPLDGRTLVVDPESPAASPNGWVDTFLTDGPNVHAQTDTQGTDAFIPGVDAKPIGAGFPGPLTFDYPIDLTQPASNYKDALVANLFYWNNILHDVHWLYGFDAANFNFEGNDFVIADAQDGSGTNNANFLTLPDGTPGRMQMFLWTPPADLRVNSPYTALYFAKAAGFGDPLDETGVTGDLQLVDDGAGAPNDACEAPPWASDVTGKIALLDRGTCEFGTKMLHAEEAGAIAAVLVDIQSDEPVSMGPGADGASVNIPSVSIGKGSGAEIKASIGQGNTVNVTMRAGSQPNRDSDFDNAVIAHEYGHGVSIRLTGDGGVNCLDGEQQAGEGWADWWGLALTQPTGVEVPGGRGIGTYLTFVPTTGGGIRPFKYSSDMSINPQTYGDLTEGRLSVPHGVGTVWATTTWDMYWALVRGVPELELPALGFEPDVHKFDALKGNTIALQLVMDGLKLQGCSPSMLTARDAILTADEERYAGAYRPYIWWAFARRGMGINAISNGTTLDVTEDFYAPEDVTGVCPPPRFRGVGEVVNNSEEFCQLVVTWPEAEGHCTGPVSYDLFRSTDPDFVPGPESLLAGGLSTREYQDYDVASGSDYTYVVRSRQATGEAETNLSRLTNSPARFTADDPDGLLDDAGDTVSTFTGVDQGQTWVVRDSGGAGDSKAYAISAASNYPNGLCIHLESEIMRLGDTPTLSFTTRWDTEETFDGGIVEIATEAGGFNDWTKLDDILYPGAMIPESPVSNTTCPNPGLGDGQPAFTGTSNGSFVDFSSDLSPWAGQSVKVRFVFSSDASVNANSLTGLGEWLVDNIAVDELKVAEACAANLPPIAVPLAVNSPVIEGQTAMLSGAGSSDPENGVLSYAWTQTGGPFVLINDADTATPNFLAPNVAMDTDLTFELRVTDVQGLSATDTVVVTVLDSGDGAGGSNNTLGGSAPPLGMVLMGLLALGRRWLCRR